VVLGKFSPIKLNLGIFESLPWKSALVVVKKYSNITIVYLQRRRKVFLNRIINIILQVKLLMIHMHGDITSNVGISKCSRPAIHFPVKLGSFYSLRIRLIFQIQTSLQYYLPDTGDDFQTRNG
jgi:hypothetical protein